MVDERNLVPRGKEDTGVNIQTCKGRQRDYFVLRVSLTVKFLRPFARRRASTLRPFLEAMRERNPCLLARFRRLG